MFYEGMVFDVIVARVFSRNRTDCGTSPIETNFLNIEASFSDDVVVMLSIVFWSRNSGYLVILCLYIEDNRMSR